jgi:hypothetical protein
MMGGNEAAFTLSSAGKSHCVSVSYSNFRDIFLFVKILFPFVFRVRKRTDKNLVFVLNS